MIPAADPWRPRAPKRRRQDRRQSARRAAGMESGRPLSRHRIAPSSSATSNGPRPNASPSRRPTRATSTSSRRRRRRTRARRGGEALREDRRRARAGSVPTPGCSTPATPPIPCCRKFYGDMQERITAAYLHLLFFTLELNRIDDAVLDKAMADPALGHYRPWIEDIRKDKPYQLEDRVEQLFQEKSMTGYSAFNRLFDETMVGSALQGRRQDAGDRADAQPAAGPEGADAQGRRPRRWPRPSRKTCGCSRWSPTRSPRTRRFPTAGAASPMSPPRAICPTASSPRWWTRWWRRCAPPIRSSRTAITRSRRAGSARRSWRTGTATRRCRRSRCAPSAGARRRTPCSTAYGAFSPKMAAIAERFFKDRWIDAPVRPGKSPGAFSHPTVPSAHPYVMLNYQGKPRDVMTLAHELGHGVHQVLAAPNGALMAPTPLTLAETASVFGEMLTFKKLLAETTDKKQRKAMLAAKVEDMINTVVRQIAFYTFERRGPHRAPQRRAHRRPDLRDLDGRAAREPRAGDRSASRLRDVLDLHPALHPFAVLRLRLCVRRLPGELALRGLREGQRRASPSAISKCSRPAAPSTIPSCSSRSASMPAIRRSGRAGSA